MKKNILFIILLTAFSFAAIAQNKRVAILETIDKENQVPYAVEVMVRSNLTKVISNTEGYEGYDRVNMSEIMDEHDFERTGLVNEEQIRQLGAIAGADYILVSEAVKVDESNIFVTAKILNVVSAKTEKSENSLMGTAPSDIQRGCESLANRLLGIQETNSQEKSSEANNDTEEKTSFISTVKSLFNSKGKGNTSSNSEKEEKAVDQKASSKDDAIKLGDLYCFPDGSCGIVFYIEDERGLVMSLDEGEECWDNSRRPKDINQLINLAMPNQVFEYGNGQVATQTLINNLSDDARAAYWCRLLGPDWYLPSIGELCSIIAAFNTKSVASKLKSLGGGKINGWYWSSTENDDTNAWNINSDGTISAEKKKNKAKVRAIRTFSIK